jgi:hypothetical protein
MGVFIDADEKFSAIRVSECGNGCGQSSWPDIN